MNRLVTLLLFCVLGAANVGASEGDLQPKFLTPSSTPQMISQEMENKLGPKMGALRYLSFSYDYLLAKWLVALSSSRYSKEKEFTYLIDDKRPDEIELQFHL